MKNLFKKISLILFLVLVCTSPFSYTFAEDVPRPVYALINAEDCPLFRSDSGDETAANRYFTLPSTYFVEIMGAGEEFHRVKYMDFTGYVRVTDVEIVDYLPVTVYPTTVTLKPDNEGFGVHLRREPKKSSEILLTIPSTAEQVGYFGICSGEESVNSYGDAWFFTEYEDTTGYVYNFYVSVIDEIPENVIERIPEQPIIQPPGDNLADVPRLNKTAQTIIIVALIIPSLFIIYLLFRKKEVKTTAATAAEKPGKTRKSKYNRD